MTELPTVPTLEVPALHVGAKGSVLLDRVASDHRDSPWVQPKPGHPAVTLIEATSWWLTVNGSIVQSHSSLRSGYTRRRKDREPKRWHRWQLCDMRTVRRTRYGYWLLTCRSSNGGRVTTKVFDLKEIEGYSPERVRVMAGWDVAGPASLEQVYPFISHYGRPTSGRQRFYWAAMPADTGAEFSRRLVGAITARDIATALFGTTRVTRALVKAVADPRLRYAQLELAWTMRGLVPTDWLIDFLRSPAWGTLPGLSALRGALRLCRPTVLRRLLGDVTRMDKFLAHDLRQMAAAGNHLRVPADAYARVRTWRDLHDALAKGVVESHGRWRVARELRGLEGQVGGLSLRLLRTADELHEVGEALHNCIAGYQGPARSGSSVLAALFDPDGHPVGALELQRSRSVDEQPQWQLQQLLGRFNRPLDRSVHDQTLARLQAAAPSRIIVDDYWGKPDA